MELAIGRLNLLQQEICYITHRIHFIFSIYDYLIKILSNNCSNYWIISALNHEPEMRDPVTDKM